MKKKENASLQQLSFRCMRSTNNENIVERNRIQGIPVFYGNCDGKVFFDLKSRVKGRLSRTVLWKYRGEFPLHDPISGNAARAS